MCTWKLGQVCFRLCRSQPVYRVRKMITFRVVRKNETEKMCINLLGPRETRIHLYFSPDDMSPRISMTTRPDKFHYLLYYSCNFFSVLVFFYFVLKLVPLLRYALRHLENSFPISNKHHVQCF